MFLVVDLVTSRRGSGALRGATAPFRQSGLLGALFLAAAVALAGTPPLSGFVGKLLVMDALRGDMVMVWPVILVGSFLMILGFARAGSHVFWKPVAILTEPAAHRPEPLAFVAVFVLIGGLALLTVFAGPVTAWLDATAAGLHDPAAYIGAVLARAGEG